MGSEWGGGREGGEGEPVRSMTFSLWSKANLLHTVGIAVVMTCMQFCGDPQIRGRIVNTESLSLSLSLSLSVSVSLFKKKEIVTFLFPFR